MGRHIRHFSQLENWKIDGGRGAAINCPCPSSMHKTFYMLGIGRGRRKKKRLLTILTMTSN
jgi:hypothetical protein